MTEFRVTVPGEPVTKGSMRGYFRGGKLVLTNDNPATRPWELAVAWAAAAEKARSGWRMLDRDVPAEVDLMFYLPRPSSLPKRVLYPVRKRDLDKLTRAIKDALKVAGVYRDDGQVTDDVIRKRFAGGVGDPSGPDGTMRVEVVVRPLAAISPGIEGVATQNLTIDSR